MSFFKRILGGFKDSPLQMTKNHYGMQRKVLTEELCENLRGLGVKATLLEPNSPEAFTWPPYVLSCIKIEERNLDMIMIILSQDEDDISYSYYYVVRGNVDSIEEELKANYRSDLLNHHSQKQGLNHVDNFSVDHKNPSHWKGGEITKILNTDSELATLLHSEGLNSLSIWPDKRRQRVMVIGRKQFLTPETFEAYDRIAYSIRRLIIESSINPKSKL